ncbi:hypothetical protein SAMN06297144_0314 [Sphingomonas guangdongensis]|uniref:Uncharacterized protein n=1 Tax=Sphingomonas guangdongensis TaxID=1141890 RepID=A0A285QAS2_9SPHN|nr:hypothetical protein [Sphingomonas guangdongensis]SOB78983.1 hypothetical protein SAMN06297144_0314 [Sphingomonas guangdongensis]
MNYLAAADRRGALLLLALFAVGLGLPDLDQLLPLGHRSALTHSMLPLLLAVLHPERRLLVPGLALGIGVHLSADSFPNVMTGYATVKLPLAGSIGRTASYLWLGAHALGCLIVGTLGAFRVLPRGVALLALGAVAAGAAAYLFVTDGGWPALLLYGGAGTAAWRWRQSRGA